MKKTLFLLVLLTFLTSVKAESPKRELRSAWIATVYRLNWPDNVISITGNLTEINAQKKQLTDILDSLVSANMNAVYFQVRSRCDAMYKSSYEPWSTDLVATRGMDPGYDPFQYLIEEAHKRGMEVHAWLNPYRYSTAVAAWSGQPHALNYETAHPDWLLACPATSATAQNRILDPGNPKVIQQIKKILGELVNNYDLDGIVFDDYFYVTEISSEDAGTQQLYKPAGITVADWRRSNVNSMVAAAYDTIQKIKPYLKFGISPRGIWSTSSTAAGKYGVTLPAGITGSDNYNSIYCDALAWLKQGTIDYISPQIYWTTYSSGQDFDVLDPWWYEVISNKYKKHFYCSHTISALSASSYMPKKVALRSGEEISTQGLSGIEYASVQQAAAAIAQEEIGLQIQRNRATVTNNAPGTVLYSAKVICTVSGFINYLKKYQFTQKSLTPAIDWKEHPTYGNVENIHLADNILSWDKLADHIRYTVYAIPNEKTSAAGIFETSGYLLGTSYSNSFTIPSSVSTSSNTFAVAGFDRYGNEFEPQLMTTDINEINAEKTTCYIVKNTKTELILNVTSPENRNVNVSLWSVSGVRFRTISRQLNTGNNTVSLPVNELHKGLYLISIEDKEGRLVLKLLHE